MQYPHIFTGPDGQSRFDDVEVELRGDGPRFSKSIHADRISFLRMPAGLFGDWHAAPRRQFIVTLAGEADLVAGDGGRRHVSAGTAMLLEDTTGKGHQTIVGAAMERLAMTVSLAPEDGAAAPAPERSAPAASSAPRAPAPPLKIPRVYSTPDGGTALDEIEIEMSGDGTSGSKALPAGRITFVRIPAGTLGDWHTEPRRQFVVTLSGEADIVTTSGRRHAVGPGTVMLFEDVEGKGHQTVVGDKAERVTMIVSLGE